jgi:hypothetical protein
MYKSMKRMTLAALALLTLTATNANADLLFTNWHTGIVGGNLYTAGGPCAVASCFAIADNFSNQEHWNVTDITVYVVSIPSTIANPGWRYALFTTAGTPIVAPTDTAVTFTDLGNYFNSYHLYKGVISGLSIDLPPGEYELRFTNTQAQSVFPAYGASHSAQSLSPGFVQLTGSSTVEALLSTDRTQRSEEWAFEIAGTALPIFRDGFDGP